MKKLLGEERRAFLIDLLKNERAAITGTDLAKRSNVSRQVIVNDMALLKARNEPIIATSQGYLYFVQLQEEVFERQIASQHRADQTEEELILLVDAGVTVKDVTIVHPVYGDLTASIMVSSRFDVTQFLQRMTETAALPLLELTEGAHLHTLSADSEAKLDAAEQQLRKHGFLVEDE
ncbi:transcription repressor NadR [Kurthia huakuii]|uniref:transcription repressor NadR n=1 Tax=Kurthia huakuii TaxID=1421019 RepID=UPI0004952B4D|nr:transcription repressor NadR [Kurthia huakuii]MBM7697893.1 transcriptional regulator of NAD metabolism [Kurthia huakuii]